MLQALPPFVAQTYQHAATDTPADPSFGRDTANEPVPPLPPVSESISISEDGRRLSLRPDRADEADRSGLVAGSAGEAQQQSGTTFLAEAALRELRMRDKEVRAHEQAHLSAAGRYASGGASFVFKRGSDGALYAVGGEVPIDLSRESTPEATIVKMQAIRRAALAPADPSAADRHIAAQASVRMAEARRTLHAQQFDRIDGAKGLGARETGVEVTAAERRYAGAAGSIANRRALMAETYKAVNELL